MRVLLIDNAIDELIPILVLFQKHQLLNLVEVLIFIVKQSSLLRIGIVIVLVKISCISSSFSSKIQRNTGCNKLLKKLN